VLVFFRHAENTGNLQVKNAPAPVFMQVVFLVSAHVEIDICIQFIFK